VRTALIGSLFSGIGGLELGLESAGLGPVAWQVEQDPFCRAVLARHWPEADRSVTDVRAAGAATLPRVDLLCGGFPCQDLSFAGKGAGLAGERSGLWFEFARIVRELRPRCAVVENVAALLSRGLGTVLGDLAAAGYDARWRCIRASDVGAPHRRERLFIVAFRRDSVADAERDELRELGQRLSGGRAGELRPRGDAELGGSSEGMADAASAGRSRAERRGAEGERTRSIDGGGGEGTEPTVEHGGRRLPGRWPAPPGQEQHPWEAPRTAKGVRDRADRLRALGNAVVPVVGREIGLWIRELGLA
jgi:DNA (cytosine-5)-methyltransferase 1